ncbi:MAG TPA: hypothetical protein VJ910_11535 [Desulfuromonadales bacterium]|nr:hypothetical protein [Desulfuromonadales bacterium]
MPENAFQPILPTPPAITFQKKGPPGEFNFGTLAANPPAGKTLPAGEQPIRLGQQMGQKGLAGRAAKTTNSEWAPALDGELFIVAPGPFILAPPFLPGTSDCGPIHMREFSLL